jgi:hypothetical protein
MIFMKERYKKWNKRIVKRKKDLLVTHKYNEDVDEEIADDLDT